MEDAYSQLGNSFENSLASDTAIDIASEYGEIALDSVITDSGVLKEIPIIKTIIAVAKLGSSVKEAYFIKKLLKFLFKLKEVSIEEKEKFLNSFKDEKNKKKVLEQILILIDRHDDVLKSEFLANLFAAYIRGEIDNITFFKLSNVIDQLSVWDILLALKDPDNEYSSRKEEISDALGYIKIERNLVSHGLYSEQVVHSYFLTQRSGKPSYELKYELTSLGRKFFRHVFNSDYPH